MESDNLTGFKQANSEALFGGKPEDDVPNKHKENSVQAWEV